MKPLDCHTQKSFPKVKYISQHAEQVICISKAKDDGKCKYQSAAHLFSAGEEQRGG